MHLPYDPTVGEGNYTNREEISYRDEDYHIAPVGGKFEVFSNFLKHGLYNLLHFLDYDCQGQ